MFLFTGKLRFTAFHSAKLKATFLALHESISNPHAYYFRILVTGHFSWSFEDTVCTPLLLSAL